PSRTEHAAKSGDDGTSGPAGIAAPLETVANIAASTEFAGSSGHRVVSPRGRAGVNPTALFAVIAVVGAGLSLAAPNTRVGIAGLAEKLLGNNNPVSRALAPIDSPAVSDIADRLAELQ